MIDNLMTQRYCSLFNLPKKGKYTFIKKDVRNVDLTKMLRKEDVLVHLASITDAASSFGREKDLENNNFKSLQHVAKAVAKKKARLIHLSSTSVYGTLKDMIDESCHENDLKPQSPYAHFKLMEEKWLKKYQTKTKLKYLTLRLGTIFGVTPGMRFHTAVNKFCFQAVMGNPLTIWKTALNQRRPYLDVCDAVKVIVFVVKKDIFCGETFNVVTQNTSVREIIKILRKNVYDLKIKFENNQIMNKYSFDVSCKKIKQLGFKFSGNQEAAIRSTVALLKRTNSTRGNMTN